MPTPWEQDEVIQPGAGNAKPMPWDTDPIVRADFSGVRTAVDTTAQKPNSNNTRFAQLIKSERVSGEVNPSLFRMDSDFQERSGVGTLPMFAAAAKDMFGGREGAATYLAKKAGGTAGVDAQGNPVVTLPDGASYRLNDEGIDSTDVANVAGNIAAMWMPASWLAKFNQAKNLGLGGRL